MINKIFLALIFLFLSISVSAAESTKGGTLGELENLFSESLDSFQNAYLTALNLDRMCGDIYRIGDEEISWPKNYETHIRWFRLHHFETLLNLDEFIRQEYGDNFNLRVRRGLQSTFFKIKYENYYFYSKRIQAIEKTVKKEEPKKDGKKQACIDATNALLIAWHDFEDAKNKIYGTIKKKNAKLNVSNLHAKLFLDDYLSFYPIADIHFHYKRADKWRDW